MVNVVSRKDVRQAIEVLEASIKEMECVHGEHDEFYLQQKEVFQKTIDQLEWLWL